MPILTLQRRLRELGRIRAGERRVASSGKTYPAKLDTWRLTSAQRDLLVEAADLWGGNVTEWPEAPSGKQYQVTLDTDTLPVVIPGEQSVSQWLELWSGGGCVRRCDGERELLSDQPCMCDPDPEQRECQPTTRLNVMLPDLTDLGQWRCESHGFYAATELAGVADLLSMAKAQFVRARLRLDQREVKRPGEPVKKFAVPTIELDVQLGRVLESMGVYEALEAPVRPALAAVTEAPDETVDFTADESDALTEAVTEDIWSELLRLLRDEFPDDNMDNQRTAIHDLFRLMDAVGLWPEGEQDEPCSKCSRDHRASPLYQALSKYTDLDVDDHLSDLKKEQLVTFGRLAWSRARGKVVDDGGDAA